ncbi:MAG: zf-HC2 domain-containing protein [Candidatus Latescibacteria bacterium]|nr:zf-HC2 domain-containing protein [Candidatus Latescibacterota bacterium]
MKCIQVQKLIVLYVSSDLPEKQANHVKSHIEDCQECATTLNEYRTFRNTIKSLAASDTIPSLPENFCETTLGKAMSYNNHLRIQEKSIIFKTFIFQKKYVVAAVALLIFTATITAGLNHHFHKMQIAERLEEVEQIVKRPEPTVMVDHSLLDNPLLEGPYTLASWKPADTEGIIAVLHKPDPINKPETYVVDYIGEFTGNSGSEFLWSRLDREQLLARAGSDDNVYIIYYPMSDSRQRQIIATAVKRKFKPYFKNGV